MPSTDPTMATTISRWKTTRTAVLGLLAVSGLLVTAAYMMVPADPGKCGPREVAPPPPSTVPQIEWVEIDERKKAARSAEQALELEPDNAATHVLLGP